MVLVGVLALVVEIIKQKYILLLAPKRKTILARTNQCKVSLVPFAELFVKYSLVLIFP